MITQKIEQAIDILKEKKIDLWLTFVRETDTMQDPVLDYIMDAGVTSQTALLITAKGDTLVITASLDVTNFQASGNYKEVISYVQSIEKVLRSTLDKLNPNSIAINFSESDPTADGLSHGMHMRLLNYLQDTPYKERLISSQPIIGALRGRKTLEEIRLMREAIRISLEIFKQAGEFIRPGRSEKEIAAFIHQQVQQRGLGFAWNHEFCPAVFSGPTTAGPHAAPSDRKVAAGHLVNIDFGVKAQGYCADLQRTWYVLKEGETQAPPIVEQGFQVLKEAIHKTVKALKPGVLGKDMDHIARQHLVDNGYQGYSHGLGHQVGRQTHDGGALLAPAWDKYGNISLIPVEVGQVYTIEPRLTVAEYGTVTIEEEVWIRENGSEFLSEPQETLWLI